MYSIGLNFEYSRMQLHSLSSGCEIAQFFVRYMACEKKRESRFQARYGEQKIAQFRTHYLTKELSYVSTQQSGYFSIDTEMI
jgi:hypothetical protein